MTSPLLVKGALPDQLKDAILAEVGYDGAGIRALRDANVV